MTNSLHFPAGGMIPALSAKLPRPSLYKLIKRCASEASEASEEARHSPPSRSLLSYHPATALGDWVGPQR